MPMPLPAAIHCMWPSNTFLPLSSSLKPRCRKSLSKTSRLRGNFGIDTGDVVGQRVGRAIVILRRVAQPETQSRTAAKPRPATVGSLAVYENS